MPPTFRFLGTGLLIAALEEFITQGVLKHAYGGWIVPTLIAFVPFLALMRLLGRWLDKGAYYLVAGSIGLSMEWFLMGLSPWSNPKAPVLLMFLFQFGMFSFWAGVAFAPRLLLDPDERVSGIRKTFKRFLCAGMALAYLLAFTVPEAVRFHLVIAAVIAVFVGANVYYVRYVRLSARDQ